MADSADSGLGLVRGMVTVVPHNDAWETEGRNTAAKLKEILGDTAVDVQHIGSTSIKGIYAKPILDLVVGVNDFGDILAKNDLLAQNGFYYRGQDIPGQHLYVCGEGEIRTHHIHVVIYQDPNWNNYLTMRNYLNSHPEDAKRYSDLKISLGEKYADDRNTYTAMKEDFIDSILYKAKVEGDQAANLPGQYS
ncbi:MAG: GrpB family protein [Saccharofermentans sp.]|nr:GrpB family protein [Saccharofermentans sp.]